ncbi:hypothetical protein DFH07DRAFT_950234 [Mycena maculata]|uniref:Rhodopsin domain-containing protein n=1 Tax=Mycena maculata TaxID=230809 RepID=A0AAD7K860_9AGAR|nr:hypothetical protein DFH07DRAFT_950234 [Mycena maculata]
MINPHDPLVELKITSATCSFFASGTAVYRLYIRRGRLWADDAWALFAFLTLIVQVVAVFLHLPVPNRLSQSARVAVYYLIAMTFYAIIWGSRLSILFSIIRVDPSPERRKRLFWVAVAFVAASLFLFAQLLWVCETESAWKSTPNPQCSLSFQVAICQLVTDIAADVTLLVAPWPLFRSLADKVLRRKLSLIFSTCVVTTIVSLVHAAFILRHGVITVVISALVEDNLSLIVANVPVVVTALIDITGEDTVVDTIRTTSLRFSSLWYNITQPTGHGATAPGTSFVTTLHLRPIAEDGEDAPKVPRDVERAYLKTTKRGSTISSIAWNMNSDDLSEGTVDVTNSFADTSTVTVGR